MKPTAPEKTISPSSTSAVMVGSTWAICASGSVVRARWPATYAITAATSNPGSSAFAAGGVGRNVAENLARLGTRTHLVAAVGADALGDQVLAATSDAGVRVEQVRRSPHATGTYTAVLDADGELVVAVSDMRATDALAPADVDAALEAGLST